MQKNWFVAVEIESFKVSISTSFWNTPMLCMTYMSKFTLVSMEQETVHHTQRWYPCDKFSQKTDWKNISILRGGLSRKLKKNAEEKSGRSLDLLPSQ